jgi:hypothetical protein
LQYVKLQELQDIVDSISSQLITSTPELNNRTRFLFQPHINYLKSKLSTVSIQLESFEVNRIKRGLIDGLGSVVKSITGNLDYTDALHFDRAVKEIRNNEEFILIII